MGETTAKYRALLDDIASRWTPDNDPLDDLTRNIPGAMGERPRDLMAELKESLEPARRLDEALAACTNCYCRGGWVYYGDGVSFGSWPCMVCKTRVADA